MRSKFAKILVFQVKIIQFLGKKIIALLLTYHAASWRYLATNQAMISKCSHKLLLIVSKQLELMRRPTAYFRRVKRIEQDIESIDTDHNVFKAKKKKQS